MADIGTWKPYDIKQAEMDAFNREREAEDRRLHMLFWLDQQRRGLIPSGPLHITFTVSSPTIDREREEGNARFRAVWSLPEDYSGAYTTDAVREYRARRIAAQAQAQTTEARRPETARSAGNVFAIEDYRPTT